MRHFTFRVKGSGKHIHSISPIVITIKIIAGARLINSSPPGGCLINNETHFLVNSVDWFAHGLLVQFYSTENPTIDVVCHPHQSLTSGILFEVWPVSKPIRRYWSEFHPISGCIIHTELAELFCRTDQLANEFKAIQERGHQLREQKAFEQLDARRRIDLTIEQPQATVPRGSAIIRRIEQSIQTSLSLANKPCLHNKYFTRPQ